jgi:serine/threonine-protein kinase RsbW
MSKPRNGPDVIKVSIPSDLDLLGVLGAACDSVCQWMGFDDMSSTQVNLAVIEAGTNGVQHGHKRDPGKTLETVFFMWRDRLEVVVHDSGPGFDPKVVDPNITAAEERFLGDRGRGMFIMLTCMDSVDFSFDDQGTHCHLVKRLNAPVAKSG